MYPVLNDGDIVLLSKKAIVEKGDIAAFYAESYKDPLLKRVIAKGGEYVQIKEGNVYVNGILQIESYVEREKNTEENELSMIVPAEEYFVLGDNRVQSADSRSDEIGTIPEAMIGKAVWRVWPPG